MNTATGVAKQLRDMIPGNEHLTCADASNIDAACMEWLDARGFVQPELCAQPGVDAADLTDTSNAVATMIDAVSDVVTACRSMVATLRIHNQMIAVDRHAATRNAAIDAWLIYDATAGDYINGAIHAFFAARDAHIAALAATDEMT